MSTRTLVLGPNYRARQVVSWETAIKLKYEGLVDVLVEYEESVSSPSVTWKIPAVVRLKKLTRERRRGVRYSRVAVYVRDGWRCQYCGRACTYRQATRDHVVPRARGGETTFSNTVLACPGCNTKKADKSCDEAGMRPMKVPAVPKELPEAHLLVKGELPPEWLPYVGGLKLA